MKVELLRAGAPECPLLRFYSTESADFASLHAACLQLSSDREISISLNSQPFVLVNVHSLTLCNVGEGGLKEPEVGRLLWRLSPYDWESVSMLLEPLVSSGESGFQWLDEAGRGYSEGISVLASRSSEGGW